MNLITKYSPHADDRCQCEPEHTYELQQIKRAVNLHSARESISTVSGLPPRLCLLLLKLVSCPSLFRYIASFTVQIIIAEVNCPNFGSWYLFHPVRPRVQTFSFPLQYSHQFYYTSIIQQTCLSLRVTHTRLVIQFNLNTDSTCPKVAHITRVHSPWRTGKMIGPISTCTCR